MTAAGSALDVQRIGVKVFCEEGSRVALPELIPIFHRWIQERGLDQVLIDVADYSHVPSGPGILLVAYEGIYGLDEGGGRRGLVYYTRADVPGTFDERLRAVLRAVLAGCRKLAAEPELQGRLAFRGDELQLFANDRLRAPNTEATLAAVRPALKGALDRLYPGAACTVVREPDARERFAVTVTVPGAVAIDTLLARLDA
jgi:hypothetical protein